MIEHPWDIKPAMRRHLKYRQALKQLTAWLDQHEIDYRVLKGIPLNQLLYGDQMRRQSRDIDILIHEENFGSSGIPVVCTHLAQANCA